MTYSKSLYDLARILERWESEGGAAEGHQGSEFMQGYTLAATEERILRCLGGAVILQWNDLPTETQRKLFEDAASLGEPERRSGLKQQIARFLQEHKDDP
jgi:hypothetical protein